MQVISCISQDKDPLISHTFYALEIRFVISIREIKRDVQEINNNHIKNNIINTVRKNNSSISYYTGVESGTGVVKNKIKSKWKLNKGGFFLVYKNKLKNICICQFYIFLFISILFCSSHPHHIIIININIIIIKHKSYVVVFWWVQWSSENNFTEQLQIYTEI